MKKKSPRQHIYIPLTDDQWRFIQDHVTVEQRVKLWMDQAAKNAGETLEQQQARRSAQDEFYAKLRDLTKDLSKSNDMEFFVRLPMTCNADSVDVESFVVNVWSQPVTNENYIEIGHKFRRWYKENYPGEYATQETAIFNPMRIPT